MGLDHVRRGDLEGLPVARDGVLEAVAAMAQRTLMLEPAAASIDARSRPCLSSASFLTTRIPRPPPPAAAFTKFLRLKLSSVDAMMGSPSRRLTDGGGSASHALGVALAALGG